MNIGDRVRLLHSNEEGIVSKVISNTLVEVEIEEGFHIPVKISELVIIAKEENLLLERKRSFVEIEQIKLTPDKPKILAQLGIYTAFTAINDRFHSLHLINNTDYDLPFVMGIESENLYKGVFTGKIPPKDSTKVYEVNIQDFENWGVFVFQFLFFRDGRYPMREPMIKRVRYRAGTFFKSKQNAPILNREAYLMQLDKDEKIEPSVLSTDSDVKEPAFIDPQKIKEEMLKPKNQEVSSQKVSIKAPKLEVDLHIEAITEDYEKLNSAEIIQLQIKTFESNLEAAIACGMYEIIFIHGVGNGKLRSEIQRRLSGNPGIKYFQDAQKEKFGYGATLVRFK